MIKKILLLVVIIGIVAVALFSYGTYKVADEYVKDHQPQLKAYAQMDESAQDKYVLENADELLAQATANAKPDEKEDVNLLQAIKNDPAVQKATTELGRAIMAAAILHSEEIVKDLNAQLKTKFEQEKSQLGERLAKYGEVLDAAEQKLKGEQ